MMSDKKTILCVNKAVLNKSKVYQYIKYFMNSRYKAVDFLYKMTQGAAQHKGKQIGTTAAPCFPDSDADS